MLVTIVEEGKFEESLFFAEKLPENHISNLSNFQSAQNFLFELRNLPIFFNKYDSLNQIMKNQISVFSWFVTRDYLNAIHVLSSIQKKYHKTQNSDTFRFERATNNRYRFSFSVARTTFELVS